MQKSLGERLKALRGNQSQISFCEKISQKQGTYSAWERDEKDPSASAIAVICRSTGVSADWLLGLSDAASRSVDVVAEKNSPRDGDAYWRDLVASQQGTIAKLTVLLAEGRATHVESAPAGGRAATKGA